MHVVLLLLQAAPPFTAVCTPGWDLPGASRSHACHGFACAVLQAGSHANAAAHVSLQPLPKTINGIETGWVGSGSVECP